MYEEIVKQLRKQHDDMDCGNCNTCVKLKAADAIEALEALLRGCSAAVQKPEVENSEVDEDGILCEVSVPVLGLCVDGQYRVVHRIDESTMESGDHEWHGWTTLGEERVVDVEFWWTLPTPPKEEAND